MISQRTVFVIGAGAGCEIDMPTGSRLRQTITEKLDFGSDEERFAGEFEVLRGDNILRTILSSNAATMMAAHTISHSLPLVDSIDDYVDNHPGDEAVEFCAKIAIVQAILEAERASKFFINDRDRGQIEWLPLDEVWFLRMFRILRTGLNQSNVENIAATTAFINFNYDRALEHFLYLAIRDLFQLPESEAAQIVGRIPIYHPYGSVGRLPWYRGTSIACQFGGPAPSPQHLVELSRGIKTYTESVESGFLDTMQRVFDDAHTIVFLGFAYHRQNMSLLRPQQGMRPRRMFGTAFERSDADRLIIEEVRLRGLQPADDGGADIELVNATCGDFFRDYGIALQGQ